eukprot:3767198-Alexandrium_andersonii.AAC.1
MLRAETPRREGSRPTQAPIRALLGLPPDGRRAMGKSAPTVEIGAAPRRTTLVGRWPREGSE